MKTGSLALILTLMGLVALLLPACGDADLGAEPGVLGDDDDDDDAPPEPLFDQLLGTIDYEMSYTDGVLEGEDCVETYELTTVDVDDQTEQFERLHEDCPDCGTLYLGTFDLVDPDACVGGPELNETNYIALDLSTEPGWATFWWGGSQGEDWYELTSGEIDFDEVVIVVEDQGGGWTNEEPCDGWWNSCEFDAVYVNYFDLGSTDRPEDD